jgi:hypothetical protein
LQLVERLIAYEEGHMTDDEEIALFQHLIDTGTCWHLSGHYHRVAATLIEAGLIKHLERAEAKSSNPRVEGLKANSSDAPIAGVPRVSSSQ